MVISENENTFVMLDNLEQSILLIARQLISRHYLLNTKILSEECTRTMKDVDYGRIEASITNLINKRILLDGKAVTRETILENEPRSSIYDLIRAEPGIYLNKIIARMQLDSRTVTWYLQMLEEFSLIRSTRIGNNMIYFVSGVDPSHEIAYYYMHKKDVPEIINALMENPGISFVQLLALIDLPRTTLSRKVIALIEAGILTGIYDSGQLSSLTVSEKFSGLLIK